MPYKIQRTGFTFPMLIRLTVVARTCRGSHHARNLGQRIPG